MAPTTSQQIKERFNTFNSELESLFETQKTLYIGDEELRERMKNGIRSMLIQRYVDCREKYEKVNFSKDNKNKYLGMIFNNISYIYLIIYSLAYNAETLEDMISQFFEGHFSTKKTKYT